MLSNIIGRIFSFFTMLFGVFQAFIGWAANHAWALVLAIVSPVMGLFWAVWDWLQSAVKGLAFDLTSSQDVLDSFGDAVNGILTSSIFGVSGGGTIAQIFADIVDVLNFGAFVTYFMSIVVPVALIVLTYRFVKSWLPIVSGS